MLNFTIDVLKDLYEAIFHDCFVIGSKFSVFSDSWNGENAAKTCLSLIHCWNKKITVRKHHFTEKTEYLLQFNQNISKLFFFLREEWITKKNKDRNITTTINYISDIKNVYKKLFAYFLCATVHEIRFCGCFTSNVFHRT